MATKIILVEDLDSDAELIEAALRRAKLRFTVRRVMTGPDLEACFQEFDADIVLTDHSLPQFSGMDVLGIVHRLAPGMPVIVVTGSLNEETAVEYIKAGAADYVLKDRPARLGAAIRGALNQRRMRDEARLADEALRHSETRYRLLFESNPHPMWVVDRETLRFLAVNEAAELVYGFSRTEFLSMTALDIRPAEDTPAFVGSMDSQRDGVRLTTGWRHRKKDGTLIDVEVSSHPVEFEHRPGLLVLITDVTERKRADQQARESSERYHRALDGMMEGCQMIGPDWRYLYINDAAVRHGRVPREQLLGRTMGEVYPGIEATEMFVNVRRCAVEQVPIHMENEFVYPDSSRAWFELRIQPVPEGVFVLSIDVTERKLAEQSVRAHEHQLRESEERFRQMAEHIKEAFFVVDLATRQTLYISPTWSEIWGRPLEDGRDPSIWIEAIHPDDRPALLADQEAVARGESGTTIFRVRRPDGTMRWVRGRAFPVRDASGQVYRMVGVSEDITDLRRVQEQMAQAQKMEAVGRLAGGVAHDFNNLLTVIIGESDLAQREIPTGGPVSESLAEIRKAGERAATLTRQLLAFSRHQVVEQTVFKLNDAVSDMDKMLRRLIGEDITFETRLHADAGVIRADRGQMEQVLANLVVNARDAMPDGGRLIVETAVLDSREPRPEATGTLAPGRYVVMGVTDTGAGMDADVRAHIFEPFFTTKAPGKGTGLGLSTVYGIVTQAGGQIGVYSELGLGTTFRIYLPLAEAATAAGTRGPQSVAVHGGDETILLVEDDAGVRRLARASLERVGYRILEAGDPAEALRLADGFTEDIHLLMTDVVMPGMGGQELVARLAPLRPGMKILFTSGYTERAVTLEGGSGGAPNFIQKPFTPDELALKVRRVLSE